MLFNNEKMNLAVSDGEMLDCLCEVFARCALNLSANEGITLKQYRPLI